MTIDRVVTVFRGVFNDPDLVITPQTTARDVKDWDSFNHINLVLALEDEFRVTFTTDEIAAMANVGDLVSTLQKKGVDVSW